MAHELNNKLPGECTSIDDVRNEIDIIDSEIIRLLATRFDYVREVVKYKEATPTAIEANHRRDEVMRSRRQWAQAHGLNPDVIEQIYDRLVQYFIDEEKKLINV